MNFVISITLDSYITNIVFNGSQSWPVVARHVENILKNYPRLKLTNGRKVSNFLYMVYFLLIILF